MNMYMCVCMLNDCLIVVGAFISREHVGFDFRLQSITRFAVICLLFMHDANHTHTQTHAL